MNRTAILFLLTFIYGGGAAYAFIVARSIPKGDPIRRMLLWMSLSSLLWSMTFSFSVWFPNVIPWWAGLFLFTATWPAFTVGFIQFAVRWGRELRKVITR